MLFQRHKWLYFWAPCKIQQRYGSDWMVLNNMFYPDLIIMQLATFFFSMFMLVILFFSFLGKPLFSLPWFHNRWLAMTGITHYVGLEKWTTLTKIEEYLETPEYTAHRIQERALSTTWVSPTIPPPGMAPKQSKKERVPGCPIVYLPDTKLY